MSKLNAQGLKMIAEGLLLLAQTIESSEKVEAAPAVQKVTKTVETKEEKTAEATESGSYTAEQLEEMSYNDIKKLAKSLGISAVGNRTALVNAILGVSEDSEDEPEAEDEEFEETAADEDEDSEDDSEDEDDDEDTDEDDDDDISAQVESAVADMSDDEIRELLADAELSTKGKRQALIARLVEAVEEGVIEFGDDVEESDEDESEEDADDADDGDITKGMTKERRAAYDQVCKDTESDFESGDITRDDLIEFINDFNGTDDKFKKVSDEELLEKYLTIVSYLISDDGDISEEPGLYTVNEESFCCGHPVTFNKKKNAFVCSVCGATYEA